MVTQKERVSASFVILQQMISPCGLIAVSPPYISDGYLISDGCIHPGA